MNLLSGEKSPYLLQHASNPVHWEPWGDAAFARAQRENKPVFLSIGYSTCHWCHVMAHESFEDPETAQILNDHFVAVKVDREERPDVDRVYMTFVQATTGHGGWPLNAWLTPGLKPFYGGTYFPPADRYGRPGFPTVLRRIAQLWGEQRENLVRQGDEILQNLALAETAQTGDGASAPTPRALDGGYASIRSHFDERNGGFSHAPKFPRPATLHFLFRYGARTQHDHLDDASRHALEMALLTLDKMAAGGMHDHLGGGFHRYSVDELWHVPHFEKMLYDQAQLALAYLEGYQIAGEERHAAVARAILDYVRRDLLSPDGGFYSAEDADSLIAHGRPEHAEGAFYVWTEKEIEEIVGTEGGLFGSHYGIDPEGNAPPGSDPHGEFTGKNILIERQTVAETARRFDLSESEAALRLAAAREALLAKRNERPRPHLDDKVITAWNGLMISAFARAAQILGEPEYAAVAARAARFVLARLHTPETGRLLRSFREGPGRAEGFADDYAFLIAGLLDLYETDFDTAWLRQALALQRTMDALFWDARTGGYFATTGEDPTILIRSKEEYDGAEPSAGSIAAANLIRFADLLGQPALLEGAERVFAAAAGAILHAPATVPQLLASYAVSCETPRHVVIVGEPDDAGTQKLLAEAWRHFLPRRTILRIAPGADLAFLGEKAGFFGSLEKKDGKATAYYCEHYACRLPVTDAYDLGRLLEGKNPEDEPEEE